MLLQPRNQHENWIFFFQFSSSEKKTACIYQHHSHKKTSCYSNQEINMQTGFFSSFPAQKNSMHMPTSFSQKKNCMLFEPRNQYANWIFFSQFSSSENKHAYTNIILTKKQSVIRTKKSTCKWDIFSSFPAQKNSIHTVHVLHVQTP